MDVGRREDGSGDEAFEAAAAHFELPEGARAFAKELLCGVTAHRSDLDAALSEHARNWRMDRMAVVDRNVLRLAAFEILYTDTPAEVAIDEAVTLARRFGSEPSPGFVNGVLDGLARANDGTQGANDGTQGANDGTQGRGREQ
jgi:N utilization substance protein B